LTYEISRRTRIFTNSHLIKRRFKRSTNFKSAENVQSSNVIGYEFELHQIPSQHHPRLDKGIIQHRCNCNRFNAPLHAVSSSCTVRHRTDKIKAYCSYHISDGYNPQSGIPVQFLHVYSHREYLRNSRSLDQAIFSWYS